MRRWMSGLAFVLGFTLSVAVAAQSGQPPSHEKDGFRGVGWGATRAEVVKSEGREPVYDKADKGAENIVFEDRAFGMKVQVIYSFDGGKLVHAGYVFLEDHADKRLYIDDYRRVRAELKRKFGDPAEVQDEHWSADSASKSRGDYGEALAQGKVSFESSWETVRSYVILNLQTAASKTSLGLAYISKESEKSAADKPK